MKYKPLLLISLTLILGLLIPSNGKAAPMAVEASLASNQVRIGCTVSIVSKTKEVTYQSSRTDIAYVSPEGRITGKKAGTAIITISKSGYAPKTFNLKVVENEKLPFLSVCCDETTIQDLHIISGDTEKGTLLSAKIKNLSKHGTAQSIRYTFDIKLQKEASATSDSTLSADGQTLTKRVTLEAGPLNPQAYCTVTCEGPDSGLLEDIKLISTEVYSENGLMIYNAEKNTFHYTWGKPDTTPPVIWGIVGQNSYNKNEVYITVYPDKKYDFTKYVKVKDDRDKKVQLHVDTSQIDWSKKGICTVTFSAADAAGNKASAYAKVQVRQVETAERYADTVLNKIIKSSWSDTQKVDAIYKYVRKNLSYVDNSDHANWDKSAVYGLQNRSGNCFVFYSLSKLLLTRSGIPNITVTRSHGHGNHWWNLVYVQDGWYHFDTTPMYKIAITCLLTDSQLTAFSDKIKSEHYWDKSAYPPCAAKPIRQVIMGRRY